MSKVKSFWHKIASQEVLVDHTLFVIVVGLSIQIASGIVMKFIGKTNNCAGGRKLRTTRTYTTPTLAS